MVTHNNDCTDCDLRLAVIPAASHSADSACPIYPCKFGFPRFVGDSRGSTYTLGRLSAEGPFGSFNATTAIGHIQQVHRTYSYIEGSYPIANEWGLAMGESTCTGRFVAYGPPMGDALYDVTALMRIAMERCKTARCAVKLMGQLAEQGGYHGSDDPQEEGEGLFEEAGEALTLIDSTGEAWVFHILPDDTGRSAVWAAQRLADDEMTVVANKMTIRALDLSRPDVFLASSNVKDVAVRAGLWPSNSTALLDFAAVYAPDALDPPGWVDRRVWHLFNKGHTHTHAQPYRLCLHTLRPQRISIHCSPSHLC
jgi:dipeptidase